MVICKNLHLKNETNEFLFFIPTSSNFSPVNRDSEHIPLNWQIPAKYIVFGLNNNFRGHPSFLFLHSHMNIPFVLHPFIGKTKKSHMLCYSYLEMVYQLPDIHLQCKLTVKLVCIPQQNGRKGLLNC